MVFAFELLDTNEPKVHLAAPYLLSDALYLLLDGWTQVKKNIAGDFEWLFNIYQQPSPLKAQTQMNSKWT